MYHGRIKKVGFYIGEFYSKQSLNLLRGVSKAADKLQVELIVASGGSEDTQDNSEMVYRHQVFELFTEIDALLITSNTKESRNALISALSGIMEEKDIPLLFLGDTIEGYSSIGINQREAFKKLVLDVLSSQKRKKPAMLCGPENYRFAQELYQGYLDALRELGLSSTVAYWTRDLSEFSGYNGVKALESQLVDCDVLFCASDELAGGALKALSQGGVSIPNDIWLTGFGNTSESIAPLPEITTVELYESYLGIEALKRLNEGQIKKGEHISLSPVVLPRLSTDYYSGKLKISERVISPKEIGIDLCNHLTPFGENSWFPTPEDWEHRFIGPLMQNELNLTDNPYQLENIFKQECFFMVGKEHWPSVFSFLLQYEQYFVTQLKISPMVFNSRIREIKNILIYRYWGDDNQAKTNFSLFSQHLSIVASQKSKDAFFVKLSSLAGQFGIREVRIALWEDYNRKLIKEVCRIDGQNNSLISSSEENAFSLESFCRTVSLDLGLKGIPVYLPLFGIDSSAGLLVLVMEEDNYIIAESIRSLISLALFGANWVGSVGLYSLELEERVLKRTKDLEDLNRTLKDEILEKELAAAQLKKSESRYKQFFDEDLTGDFVVDNTWKVVDCNKAFARIFGYPSTEYAIGVDFRSFFSSYKERRKLQKMFLRLDQLEYFETQMVRPDGRTVEVVSNVIGVRDESGNFKQLRGYLFDNTPRKHLERQLQQSQKMEGLGRLAGGIAHDFNNLLTVINGYCELILSDLPNEFEFSGELQDVYNAGQKAASLTNQLLAFSRGQSVVPKRLGLNSVVFEMGNMFRRLLGDRIQFSMDLEAEDDIIKADKSQLEQILMNLVLNSKDALKDGGTLAISTELRFFSETSFESGDLLLPGRYICLSVADNGIGMDEDTQRHVYEPFFTTKTMGKGTGLGLSTVYGIIRQMDGHLMLFSEQNKGTRFDILFDLHRDQVSPVQTRKEPLTVSPRKSGVPILLVEDETQVREYTSRLLKRIGYKVLEAYNGEMAIQIAKNVTGELPLLITDVIMPGLSGPEVASEIKKIKKGIEVVFISGYTDDQLLKHGVDINDVHLMHKPFKGPEFIRLIEDILAK